MPPTEAMAVAASAPGKVLFAGGFLVLDRKHTGLVFGLNARIHVHVQPLGSEEATIRTRTANTTSTVLVKSPQFLDASWLYEVSEHKSEGQDRQAHASDGVAVNVRQIQDDSDYTQTANKFVETTLLYVLTYLAHVPTGRRPRTDLKITILADNDYYSQPTESSSSDLSASGTTTTFSNFGVKLSDAHKTGLGSSAALVTALVSALLVFHGAAAAKRQSSKSIGAAELDLDHRIIHNLAQAAHCAAQGKVGSGFDVAAAVYGSCLYRRFTPTILEAVGEPNSPGFGERLHRCVDDLELDSGRQWDVEVARQAVQIPDDLALVMCDVDCGSETPGMVRKVLQWRKERAQEAELLWNALQQGMDDLCRELKRLAGTISTSFAAAAGKDGGEGGNGEDAKFKDLADILLTIRSLVREMSARSGVPVEPPVITELLDFCTALPGVVGGVAPGAGGYDAVALLVKNDPQVVRHLHDRLDGWRSRDGGSTGATIGKVRLLGVKQEKEGVRLEDGAVYRGWV
ncbi:Phosphomevalonate kinase erg8 [Exophiala dermatitidis]